MEERVGPRGGVVTVMLLELNMQSHVAVQMQLQGDDDEGLF